MLTCFVNYCKKSSKPIAACSLIGAISGGITLSNYCSDNISRGFCENNYADSQIAAITAGSIAGAASGAISCAIFPIIDWCYSNFRLRVSGMVEENSLQDDDIGQDLSLS